jgi:hypothetical protein
MNDRYIEIYKSYPTEKLEEIASGSLGEYRAEAIDAAQKELFARGEPHPLGAIEVNREESTLRALVWPDIRREQSIERVIRNGMIASFAIAALNCASGLWMMVPPLALLGAVLLAALGYGIGRKSRACAVLSLIFYLGEQVFAYLNNIRTWKLLVVIVTFVFINAVRGTFAYHRLKEL